MHMKNEDSIDWSFILNSGVQSADIFLSDTLYTGIYEETIAAQFLYPYYFVQIIQVNGKI